MNLEGILLSEIKPDRESHIVKGIAHMRNLKTLNLWRQESRTVVARGWGGGEKGDTSQSAQTSVILIPDQLSN